MKRLILSIVISVPVIFHTGCARPCFYQAGKNIEQCEGDNLQCIQEANNSGYTFKNALHSSIAAGKSLFKTDRRGIGPSGPEFSAESNKRGLYYINQYKPLTSSISALAII